MAQPKHIGKYQILQEIGHGGFATVYKARDPSLDQLVALKVLRGAHAEQPNVVQRFLDEARKTVKLRHRGIVRIYAVGEESGAPYIAMEYLPGGTLADRLHGQPLPLDAAITIVEQIAAALDHAHKHKLVHRDVKPANVLFDDEDNAVLVDFGLVKSLVESGLTVEGTSLGTPHYMAPEQADTAAEIDARADVYALGVVAYEMLAGRVPFDAETPLAVLRAHAHDIPPDPRALNEALDEDIAAALLKSLEKAPAGRYQSAGAFARALRQAEKASQRAAQTEATLETLYAQVQEALGAGRWGVVVNLCVEMRNLDPDYRDASTLLARAASRLAEEEQKRQQEHELGERYAAALKLLEKKAYAEAIKALEEIAAQTPDFQDVTPRLEEARAGLEKAQLYEAALAKLADQRHDEACSRLLQLLKLDPGHAAGRARLTEAAAGVLTQLEAARAELKKAGGKSKTLRARVSKLESGLKEAQTQIDAYDALLLALADDDQAQARQLTEQLARSEQPGVARFLARLQADAKGPDGSGIQSKDDIWLHPTDGKEMVRIPAGKFLYGDDKKEIELPEFWIDKTPVTNAEYARFVEATGQKPPQHWNGKSPPKEIADHPVTNVSWNDAAIYCKWADKRLPSEEEWEKAARGTDGREYPWGDKYPTRELCNVNKIEGSTTPVGKYSPQGDSPYGCVDMAGNVWEWTASSYDKSNKMLRGGSFYDKQAYVRASHRYRHNPGDRFAGFGFRCVAVAPGR